MYSPETQSLLAALRAKTVAGTATEAELRQAIILMSEGRKAAATGAAGGSKRAAKPKPSADSLFSELDSLT